MKAELKAAHVVTPLKTPASMAGQDVDAKAVACCGAIAAQLEFRLAGMAEIEAWPA